MERLLTAKEVSINLNLPLQRVYELTRRREIPAVRVFRQYRYDPAALVEWANSGGVVEHDETTESGFGRHDDK
jgi:excisionase family DNA binding protein